MRKHFSSNGSQDIEIADSAISILVNVGLIMN